jgi:hypothetical protein
VWFHGGVKFEMAPAFMADFRRLGNPTLGA